MYNAYSPAETAEIVSRAGVAKAHQRVDKTFMSAVMAGMLLSFACATLLSTNAAPWYQENAPGLIRTIGSLVFPYGLCMIVLTGSELCTATFMYTTLAAAHGRISILNMLRHWFLCFFSNLAGSLFIVTIIAGYGGVFEQLVYRDEVQKYATMKQVTPQFHQIFLRGIGANWLVCLACFLGSSGRDLASKVVGIWWPTFAFVSLAFDHVVANMFFIPIGIWVQTPGITVGLYIWKGIIPTVLGNMVGGGLFVGTYFWYLFLQGNDHVIDGLEYDKPPPPNSFGLTMDKLSPSRKRKIFDEETLREPQSTSSEKEN